MVALCIGQKAKLPACGLEFGYIWGLDDFGSKKRPIVRNKWLLPQCRVDMQKYVVGFEIADATSTFRSCFLHMCSPRSEL